MFYNLERVPSKTCYVEARARTPNRDRAHEITKSDCKTRKRHKIHVVHPIQKRPQMKASESFTIQRGELQEVRGDMPLSSSQLNNNKKLTARILEQKSQDHHFFFRNETSK